MERERVLALDPLRGGSSRFPEGNDHATHGERASGHRPGRAASLDRVADRRGLPRPDERPAPGAPGEAARERRPPAGREEHAHAAGGRGCGHRVAARAARGPDRDRVHRDRRRSGRRREGTRRHRARHEGALAPRGPARRKLDGRSGHRGARQAAGAGDRQEPARRRDHRARDAARRPPRGTAPRPRRADRRTDRAARRPDRGTGVGACGRRAGHRRSRRRKRRPPHRPPRHHPRPRPTQIRPIPPRRDPLRPRRSRRWQRTPPRCSTRWAR